MKESLPTKSEKMQNRLTKEKRISVINEYQNGLNCTELAQKYRISPSAIFQFLKRKGIKLKTQSELQRKYSLNENYFDVIDTEEKAYFLGLLFADGYVHHKSHQIVLSLQKQDSDIVRTFQKALNSSRPLLNIKPTNGKEQIRLVVQSAKMVKTLNSLGCFQGKSFLIQFPTIPKELEKHFIRGYFDGDGSIGINKSQFKPRLRVSICGNKKFLNELKRILPLSQYNGKPIKMRSIFRLEFSCNSALNFLNWLYINASIYGRRKYQIYNSALNILRFGQNLRV